MKKEKSKEKKHLSCLDCVFCDNDNICLNEHIVRLSKLTESSNPCEHFEEGKFSRYFELFRIENKNRKSAENTISGLELEIENLMEKNNNLEEHIEVIQKECSKLARENIALQIRLTKIEQEYLNLTVYRKRND